MYTYEFTQESDYNGLEIRNALIKKIDLDCVGHFGDIIIPKISIESGSIYFNFMYGYNITRDCGYFIRHLVRLLDLSKDDGVSLSDIRNIPCRVVCKDTRHVAIGHFTSDRFLDVEGFIDWCNNGRS